MALIVMQEGMKKIHLQVEIDAVLKPANCGYDTLETGREDEKRSG
jgi:hypothetical protein